MFLNKIIVAITLVTSFALVLIFGCSSEESPYEESPYEESPDPGGVVFDEPWPDDLDTVLTANFTDGTGDLILLLPEQGAPPYSGPVSYPPVDITQISFGVEGDFLYIHFNYAGAIPFGPYHIQASGEVEEQWVKNQGTVFSLNVDGVDYIDIFFVVGFQYGLRNNVYCNWDFMDNDVDKNQEHMEGEFGQGGSGYNYAIVRYDMSDLGSFFPRGQTVDIEPASECQSYNADGSVKYHHFTFDHIDGGSWDIPAQ